MEKSEDADSGAIWTNIIKGGNFGAIADWFTTQFFNTGIGAIVVIGLAAGLDGKGWQDGLKQGLRVFALSVLIAGACTVSGWLLGLLFGIPRSLARGTAPAAAQAEDGEEAPPSQAATAQARASRVNTNLEDISDWLTKTIVGVGLTQLYQVPAYLWTLAAGANTYGFGWNPYGHLLALGLIFYFTPGGFWLGYVGTRTILTKLFDWVDGGPSQAELKQAADLSRRDDGSIGRATTEQAQVDTALLATPLKQLTTTTQIMAWAAAQARARNFDQAKVALKAILIDEPDNQKAGDLLYTVQSAEMVEALYDPRPQGFVKAIQLGEALLRDSRSENDADLHVWLACAYGQKYADAKLRGTNPEALAQIKKCVLREIDAALRLDPGMRGRLFEYWQPRSGSDEDDLSAFSRDDPDMGERLNQPSQ